MPKIASTTTSAARQRDPSSSALDLAAGGDEIVVRASRIAAAAGPDRRRDDRIDLQPALASQAREHVAVAAVVPRTADDRDALRRRPATAQRA